MGTELFSQKFTFQYWFYYLKGSHLTHYLEELFLSWHQFAPVIIKTVTPHRSIISSGMLWDPKSNIVQITSFIPYLQTECSQDGLTMAQIWSEKLADTPRVFLFIVLWQTMALKMVFENHSLFIFINKHGITWHWHTQCDHRIRGVVKHWELPKSIQFSGCLQEISTLALAYLWFLEFGRFSQRRGWAGTSHWKGSRLWGQSVLLLSEGG